MSDHPVRHLIEAAQAVDRWSVEENDYICDVNGSRCLMRLCGPIKAAEAWLKDHKPCVGVRDCPNCRREYEAGKTHADMEMGHAADRKAAVRDALETAHDDILEHWDHDTDTIPVKCVTAAVDRLLAQLDKEGA
jgi:hypothetical protein